MTGSRRQIPQKISCLGLEQQFSGRGIRFLSPVQGSSRASWTTGITKPQQLLFTHAFQGARSSVKYNKYNDLMMDLNAKT